MAAIKFSKQGIEPNPQEVDYWVDITANPYGGNIKYFDGVNWIDLTSGEGGNIDLNRYYTKVETNILLSKKASVESVESKVDDAEIADLVKKIEFQKVGADNVQLVLLKYDGATVGVTMPIASNTSSGIITATTFKDLVKQYQLQALYSEMYDKLAELRKYVDGVIEKADNAATMATDAAELATEVAEHPTYVGEDNYVYMWDTTAKSYTKTSVYVRGEGFSISKIYSSIDEMNADVNHGLKEGDFVLINSGDVEDPDNAKLYAVTSTGKFKFVVDISGAIGFTGKTPQLSIGTVNAGTSLNDAAVAIVSTGQDSEANPTYDLNFIIPRLSYNDLTEDNIKELQRPANDMIAVLEQTNSDVIEAEELRVSVEQDRVIAEQSRVNAESARVEAESKRVDAETIRESQEATRVTNETIRINSEQSRINEEQSRIEAEDNRDAAEQLRISNEDARKTAEQNRITAENNRVSEESKRVIAENARVSAEETRKTFEDNRVAAEKERNSAEQIRVNNETSRVIAEQIRQRDENIRNTAESNREQNEEVREQNERLRESNESTRESNEESRVNSETLRTNAENVRNTNESARVIAENERASAEDTRKANEQIRIDNETARQTAEDNRVIAEQSRVDAETNRAKTFESLSANMTAATEAAIETAEHPTYIGEDQYVYTWDSVNDVYTKTDIYVKGDQGIQGEQGPQGIQGIQGETGKAFSIYKTYESVISMNADVNNVPEGSFVLIASNTEDVDNSKLYVKNASEFVYLSDLSGAQGLKGDKGEQGIQGIQGEQGIKGDKGDTGDTGKTPQLEVGTVTTLDPSEPASAEITQIGTTASGDPLYQINLGIPQGIKGLNGEGAGNVLVETDNLLAGKTYLFQPNEDRLAEGTFVEYEIQDISHLLSKEEASNTYQPIGDYATNESVNTAIADTWAWYEGE